MKLVILDRDGVINADRDDYVKSPAEWIPLPGSLEALAALTDAGYEIAIASNQSGIGRGLYSDADVAAIHALLRREAGRFGARIAGFYVCPHAPLAGCDCRKPAPGLLWAIARDFDCSLDGVPFVGNTDRDIRAARAAGARPILVGPCTRGQFAKQTQTECYPDLSAAVAALLAAEPGPPIVALRSLAFNVGYMLGIMLYSVPAFLSLPFPHSWVEAVAHAYSRFFYGLARFLLRLDYRIEGREHLPEGPFVFYWKHESTWETLAPLMLVQRPAFVLKRELLWIPLLGWSLARLGAIGIDRGAARKSVARILQRGQELLARGYAIVVFPEGHRMPPGETRRYGVSGALLARAAKVPIVPVAHNAGDFWPRRGFFKRAGTVRVVIGPPIATTDRAPEAINREAKEWIEAKMQELSVGYLKNADARTPTMRSHSGQARSPIERSR
ncbi:MAG TPA: D-glycero-beta-D-manno-heptose 1,7-bisphosphate 7-phosphatase [Bryobacteraceae bacterium]|nr:D-glycero-beta-D-manno-heptose 1,7-bisphosphate 7-phosphatase [Bryobacteraceae bacterium]